MADSNARQTTTSAGDCGQSQRAESWHEAASESLVPVVSFKQNSQASLRVVVPEIKALSSDRRDRRAAKEGRRELARAAFQATKAGMAMQAIQAVNVFAVQCFDNTQDEVMKIMFSRERHPNMNEAVAQMAQQMIQLTGAQYGAIAENRGKRQMEEL